MNFTNLVLTNVRSALFRGLAIEPRHRPRGVRRRTPARTRVDSHGLVGTDPSRPTQAGRGTDPRLPTTVPSTDHTLTTKELPDGTKEMPDRT